VHGEEAGRQFPILCFSHVLDAFVSKATAWQQLMSASNSRLQLQQLTLQWNARCSVSGWCAAGPIHIPHRCR